MEYKTYLARKRLKKLVICGHVNIPYGTAVTNEGGVLMWNGKPVCATMPLISSVRTMMAGAGSVGSWFPLS